MADIKKNWSVLLLGTLVLTLYLSVKFAAGAYQYINLNEKSVADILDWKIEEQKKDKFSIVAKYQFSAKGAPFTGSYTFKKLTFLNPYAAKETLEKMKGESWDIWYPKKKPEKASLQRVFPFQAMIHMILAVFVSFYFFYLSKYAKKHQY